MSLALPLNDVIMRLLELEQPTPHAVGDAIGAKLAHTRSTSALDIYDGEQLFAPITRVEIKAHKRKGWLLVVIDVDLEARVQRLDLEPPAEDAPSLSASPRIPPEGVADLTWRLDDLDVNYQVTSKTQRIRSLSFRWYLDGRPVAHPGGPRPV